MLGLWRGRRVGVRIMRVQSEDHSIGVDLDDGFARVGEY